MRSLGEFIHDFGGRCVDLDHVYGPQCVDLANEWCDNLGIERFPGNAGSFEFDSHPDCDWIGNTPTGIPPGGALVIWAASTYWGLQYGHVGVACPMARTASGLYVAGSTDSFTSFDQNWPLGQCPHQQAHSYNDLAGWLVPRKARWGYFTGKVDVAVLNVRQGPSLSAPILYQLPGGAVEAFDGYVRGDTVPDAITGQPDNRWFHIVSDGRHGWVASADVNGNPGF